MSGDKIDGEETVLERIAGAVGITIIFVLIALI